MKKYLTLITLVALFFACQTDNRERLFEMIYPNIAFELPAGLSSVTPWAFEQQSVNSNISFYLSENSTDTSAITAINPFSARITSLDSGFDFEFVEEVSIRICPEGRQPCTMADEVFYINNLRGRARQRIDLLPSLRNAKRSLSRSRFRLDVVFFFRYATPYSVSSRLDMSFEAVR